MKSSAEFDIKRVSCFSLKQFSRLNLLSIGQTMASLTLLASDASVVRKPSTPSIITHNAVSQRSFCRKNTRRD